MKRYEIPLWLWWVNSLVILQVGWPDNWSLWQRAKDDAEYARRRATI